MKLGNSEAIALWLETLLEIEGHAATDAQIGCDKLPETRAKRGEDPWPLWRGTLPPRAHRKHAACSRKVFFGGVPWDITECKRQRCQEIG